MRLRVSGRTIYRGQVVALTVHHKLRLAKKDEFGVGIALTDLREGKLAEMIEPRRWVEYRSKE